MCGLTESQVGKVYINGILWTTLLSISGIIEKNVLTFFSISQLIPTLPQFIA